MGDSAFSVVEEIVDEKCPIISSSSLKVYDDRNQKLYVYGGIRWPEDANSRSPTLKPTSEFHVYRSHPCPRWENYTVHMRQDESFISPFEESLGRPQQLDLTLPKLGSLPVLSNPIGTIVHDETASRTTYLLILGDPVGKDCRKYNHPILICINLELNTWRYIRLRGSERVPCGRSHGSMIVSGELRTGDSDVFLCVFGGVRKDLDMYTYHDSFAVANLSKATWTIPNGTVPRPIGPLGMSPGLSRYGCGQLKHNEILILKGAIEAWSATKISITNAKANLKSAYLFNPRTRINHFAELDKNTSSRGPCPVPTYMIQRSRSLDSAYDEFLVVTCGRQRALSKFPRRPTNASELQYLYVKPRIQVWVATIGYPDGGSVSDLDEQQGSILDSTQGTNDSSSEDDKSNDSSSECGDPKTLRRNPTGVLEQRAIKSDQHLIRKSGMVMTWQNVTSGRVKLSLDQLNQSFRIEAMFLRGELSTHGYALTHQLSPTLVLLGCDHEFLGEVRADLFNAFASISLRSLCEVSEDEVENEEVSHYSNEILSSGGPLGNDESDDGTPSYAYEAEELDYDGYSTVGDPCPAGSNQMSENEGRGVSPQTSADASEIELSPHDISDISVAGGDSSSVMRYWDESNHSFLSENSEVGPIPMDFEIEALVENVMDAYDGPPSDDATIGSIWHDDCHGDMDVDVSWDSPIRWAP